MNGQEMPEETKKHSGCLHMSPCPSTVPCCHGRQPGGGTCPQETSREADSHQAGGLRGRPQLPPLETARAAVPHQRLGNFTPSCQRRRSAANRQTRWWRRPMLKRREQGTHSHLRVTAVAGSQEHGARSLPKGPSHTGVSCSRACSPGETRGPSATTAEPSPGSPFSCCLTAQ